jgi:hypothetical protein
VALDAGANNSDVDASEVRSAADVERLTPDERQQLVNEHTSTDLTEISRDFVARARAEGRRLLVEHDVIG